MRDVDCGGNGGMRGNRRVGWGKGEEEGGGGGARRIVMKLMYFYREIMQCSVFSGIEIAPHTH